MKTTKQDALKIYELSIYIDPYGVCSIDKPEIIQNIMSQSLEDNLKLLQDYICENYAETRHLLEDDKAMRLYLNILRRTKRKENEAGN